MKNQNEKILFSLMHNKLFEKECNKVREKCNKADVVVTKDVETGKTVIKNYGVADKLLIKEPYRIARMFGVSSEWVMCIRDHILTGEPLKEPKEQSVLVFDKDMGKWVLYGELHTKTTLNDLEGLLKSTKKIRKELLKEINHKKLTERDVVMLDAYTAGKPTKQIKKELEKAKIDVLEQNSIDKRLSLVRRELGVKPRKKVLKKLSKSK